jgi:hypothetical protein
MSSYFLGGWVDALHCRELNRALLLNGTFLRKHKLVKLMRKYDEDGTGTLDFQVGR